MRTFPQLQQRIQLVFKQLQLPESPAELYQPIEYTLSLGGKRLRPLLTLIACEMFGGKMEEAINPAIGIELFHNFTLLHDDIMDDAPLRRGKETVYKKWNSNIAILAGDTMFALANKYLLQIRMEYIAEISGLFNQTAIEVCEGQQWDMNFEKQEIVSIKEYLEMIRLKTAVLLAASLKTGAIIAGADAANADKIYSFGIHTGLAFQLKDDLLDVYGMQDKFGKVSGGDIVACKKTFLYLKALELSGNKAADFKELYCSSALEATSKVKQVKTIFDELGIENMVRLEIELYFQKALDELTAIHLPEERKALLRDFVSNLMTREN